MRALSNRTLKLEPCGSPDDSVTVDRSYLAVQAGSGPHVTTPIAPVVG
jgi:hypothetical protein